MARAMLLIGFAAAASADTGPSARQLRGYAANAITAGARRLGTAYCIDAGSDGNPNTGDQIIVWECNGQAAQEWIWAGDSSGNYYIKYKPDTTKCMTVKCDTGKSDCSGTPVTFEDCTDSSYQHFGGANGHIYFQGSSQVVDAGAWPLSNGLGLYVYDENGNPQQNWEYGDDYHHFYNSDSQAALISGLVKQTIQTNTTLGSGNCAKVCEKDNCKGTDTNPIPEGEQWEDKGIVMNEGLCCFLAMTGHCHKCCRS